MCVGEKSCTSLLCIDLLFNKHSIVIIFVYLIVKMHVNDNGSFLWTELLMWLWNRDGFILPLSCGRFSAGRRDRTSRSQMSNSMTFCSTTVLLTFPAACAGFVVVKTCWFLVGSVCAAPASRDDMVTPLTTHMSIFNLSFLATRINSECNKGKTMNQFFHVVHNAKSAAYSSGCENSGQT